MTNRVAIATITPSMITNLEMDIRLFCKIAGIVEDMIRNILEKKYGDVSNWQIHTVQYKIESNTLAVMVSSPSFEPVPEGCCFPTLEADSRLSFA